MLHVNPFHVTENQRSTDVFRGYWCFQWHEMAYAYRKFILLFSFWLKAVNYFRKMFHHTGFWIRIYILLLSTCLMCYSRELQITAKTHEGNTVTFNPFVPDAPFFYPLKTSENRKVFWCFQGVEKGCIGNEWVNRNIWSHRKQYHPRYYDKYLQV